MRVKSKHLFLMVLAALILFGLSVQAISSKRATFILNDGKRFENVIYKVEYEYRTVHIESEGKKIDLGFLDITKILNSDGEDITSRVLNRLSSKRIETWKSESHQVYKDAKKKRWNLSLGFNGFYSIPFSNYFDKAKPGLGFGSKITFAVSKKFAGMFIYKKSGVRFDDKYEYIALNPDLEIIDQTNNLGINCYYLALQFYQFTGSETTGKTIFYTFWGIGFIRETEKNEFTVRSLPGGEVDYIEESETNNYFTQTFGLGVTYLFNDKIGLDFSGNFDIVTIDYNRDTGDHKYSYLFDLKTGIKILLGKDK